MSVTSESVKEAVNPARSGMTWRRRTYIMGAIIGLLLGVLSAYLFIRASEEDLVDQPKKIKTGDMMKMSLAVAALVRQFAEMGSK
ncbi:MAG: hypothetical protein JXN59_04675 [Anaerolineae bacterium]|nr:hypothetical protein [Anaerolineae bacterium]